MVSLAVLRIAHHNCRVNIDGILPFGFVILYPIVPSTFTLVDPQEELNKRVIQPLQSHYVRGSYLNFSLIERRGHNLQLCHQRLRERRAVAAFAGPPRDAELGVDEAKRGSARTLGPPRCSQTVRRRKFLHCEALHLAPCHFCGVHISADKGRRSSTNQQRSQSESHP